MSPATLSAQPSSGIDWISRNYQIQERLAEGLVFDLLQDKQGFLWFATEFGLVKYNGHSLITFRQTPGDERSLAGNVITALAEDGAGNLWVGTMNNGLHHFDRRSDLFTRYRYDADDSASLSHNKINEIRVSRNGKVWITTEGGGVNLFDETTNGFRRFQRPDISSNFANALLEDSAGDLWLGTFHGLNRWDAGAGRFTPVGGAGLQPKEILALAEDASGGLWIGMQQGGLLHFDKHSAQFSRISLTVDSLDEPKENYIWDILPDRSGNIWLATDGGLFHLARPPRSGGNWQVSTIQLAPNKRTLALCESRDGVIWVGTNDGVFTLAPRQKQFHHFYPLMPGEPPSTKRGVTCLVPAAGGSQIWVGTLSGLFQFDPARMRFHRDFLTTYPVLRRFKGENVAGIFYDSKGNLWISTIAGFDVDFNVYRIPLSPRIPSSSDKATGGPAIIKLSDRCLPFRSHVTFNMAEDATGDLWFANGSGLVRYLPASDSLQVFLHDAEHPESLGSDFSTAVYFSRGSGLWIATNDAGLNHYDPEKQIFRHFRPSTGDTATIGHVRVLHLREDRDGRLWLGTEGGLSVFDPAGGQGKFRNFDTRHGLPENQVNGILQDAAGFIWLSTQHSVSRFDPRKEVFTNYDRDDGLGVMEFWDRTSYKDSQGRFYFGGDNGLLVFHPDSIRANLFVPPVVFTGFLLFNKIVAPDSAGRLLPEHINFAKKITLRPHQNVFTLHFAALSYIRAGKTQYAVRMEGFEDDWQYIGPRTEATYTNLDPGRYTFLVKAANNDGVWNETGASIGIVVLPPWWRTSWALSLFGAALLAAAWTFYRFQVNRQLAYAEARRLRELDEFKTRFYTNITHEFRTPLTLILGPVEKALKHFRPLEAPDLQLVKRNGRRLLRLVNQMLDLSKLDAGSLLVHYVREDVVAFLRYLVESFHSQAEDKHIDLAFRAEPERLTMDFDKEKLAEIVGNLLSNALKFTPEGGRVQLEISGGPPPGKPTAIRHLLIVVSDSGAGIPEGELARIFDRFYTGGLGAEGGTGIGLALTKELTELMGGTIAVESAVGAGSSFRVNLPCLSSEDGAAPSVPPSGNARPAERDAPFWKDEGHARSTLSPGSSQKEEERELVLIIEDNPDVARYTAAYLSGRFHIAFAANGREGVEKALALVPDLIICDVMMPEMDGFKATRLLKNDERTSHIPIILLTARADMASRLEGLGRGADTYLAKPFHEEELLAHIHQLLTQRRKLQTYYLRQASLEENAVPDKAAAAVENAFLQKLRACLEARLDDPEFSVEDLSRTAGMSHSQLHRKMVALTGQSAQKFVRSVRLQKAKALLLQMDLTIAEVAYGTGFSEPAYFTKVFAAEFGMAPTEWRKRQ